TSMPSWRMRTVNDTTTTSNANIAPPASVRCSCTLLRNGMRTNPTMSGIKRGNIICTSFIGDVPFYKPQFVQIVRPRLLVRAVGENELERGQAEADDDGGQVERLRDRVGVFLDIVRQNRCQP